MPGIVALLIVVVVEDLDSVVLEDGAEWTDACLSW